jgi:hypothetical protein
MNIRTGDLVHFRPVPAYEAQPATTATGLVTRLFDFGGVDYALIKPTSKGMLPKLIDTRELTLAEKKDTP